DTVLFERLQRRALPDGWSDHLPTFEADEKGIASRVASGQVINAIAEHVPELWGGSADLAGSNNTTIDGVPSFLPGDRATKMWKADPLAGRVLHFGIREHGMGAIMNGIAVHGGTRVFGEDGPTHQPVEQLAALRAIPGLDVVRPGDANETAACWQAILEHTDRPAGLVLSRQNLPVFPRGTDGYSDTSNVHRGAYVLLDVGGGAPDVVLIGTGSEVQLAVKARELLAADGIRA